MPKYRKNSAKSLNQICLKNIADHMDDVWSVHYRETLASKTMMYIVGPFDHLSGRCVHEIMAILLKQRRMSRLFLELLITPSVTELDFTDCPNIVNHAIIDILLARCSSVSSLNLQGCNKLASDKLIEIVQAYGSSLNKLVLTRTNFSDVVATAIGRHCKKLSFLSLVDCKKPKFTQIGFKSLFIGPAGNTRLAETLKALHMTMCDFENAGNLIAELLLNWSPQLVCLTHMDLWEGIAQLCRLNNGPKPLKLVGDKSPFPGLLIEQMRDQKVNFKALMECVPNQKHVALQYLGEPVGSELALITSMCGANLTSLFIDWSLPMEYFLFIGPLCPNLETVQFIVLPCADVEESFIARASFEHHISHNLLTCEPARKPWSKLINLTADFQTICDFVPTFKEICSNAKDSLIQLDLTSVMEPVLNEFFMWGLESGCLKKLKCLNVVSSAFNAATMWQWLISDNDLEYVDVSYCNDIHYAEFYKFKAYIDKNDLNIKLKYDL